MPSQSVNNPEPDERLQRLGREWFDDVRRKHPSEAPRDKRRQDAGQCGETGRLGELFGSDGDADCGDAGD